jgi:hypothetical protein|tara:strand:+ start:4750 stop:4896 length:147 start_codon:yes stop_codon:yes gene_type:complete
LISKAALDKREEMGMTKRGAREYLADLLAISKFYLIGGTDPVSKLIYS